MNKAARTEIRHVTVGLLVTAVIVAVLALVFGPASLAGKATYRIHASFGQTDGLEVGSPVYAAGVAVGEVSELQLVDGYRVRATLELQADVVLDSDATAAIVTDGIFGAKQVRIDIGGGEQNIADGGVVAFTEDAVVLDDLLALIIGQARAARAASKLENKE
ncbi:MAG: MCE family protein [Alphaproteobacteria bacterium]|nr:MCE family protein [Alphaproteobacteria bacterium]